MRLRPPPFVLVVARLALGIAAAGCIEHGGCGPRASVDPDAAADPALLSLLADLLRAPADAKVGRLHGAGSDPSGQVAMSTAWLQALVAGLERIPPSGRSITKFCAFDPAVDFDLRSGTKELDIQLCFRCDQVAIDLEDGGKTKSSRIVDMGPARTDLLALTKEIFRGDSELQAVR